METKLQALGRFEDKTLEIELQHRMGRELTWRERFYLTIASACNRDGCGLPPGVVEYQRWPA